MKAGLSLFLYPLHLENTWDPGGAQKMLGQWMKSKLQIQAQTFILPKKNPSSLSVFWFNAE